MFYGITASDLTLNDFHEAWIDAIVTVISLAPEEKRREIRKRVERAITREDERYVVSGYVDRSKAAEVDSYFWGEYYLYVWLDGNGQPFYVGQAKDTDRISQYKYKTRSEEFQDKIREGGCHAVMVGKHIAAKEIDELEQNLMAYLLWKGYSLVNKRDLPSREKLVLWTTFQISKNRLDVMNRLGHDAAELYGEWKDTMKKMQPIIRVLDEVIGAAWDGECAVLEKRSEAV